MRDRPLWLYAFAIFLVLATFAARALAKFFASFNLAAADNFLFAAVFATPFFCFAWNAAHRFRCAAAIRRLAEAERVRLGFDPTGPVARPLTCLRIAAIAASIF
jgi:hypothetical protein